MKISYKIVFLLMAILYLVGIGKQFYTFVDFHVHKEAIISQFCVNIEKPELQCNGQCHLNKELSDNKVKIDFVSQDSSSEELNFTHPSFDGFEDFEYPQATFISIKLEVSSCQSMDIFYQYYYIHTIKNPPEFFV